MDDIVRAATARLVSPEGHYHGPAKHLTVTTRFDSPDRARRILSRDLRWEPDEVSDLVAAVHVLGDDGYLLELFDFIGFGHPGNVIEVERGWTE